jgi:hypothetical protein
MQDRMGERERRVRRVTTVPGLVHTVHIGERQRHANPVQDCRTSAREKQREVASDGNGMHNRGPRSAHVLF